MTNLSELKIDCESATDDLNRLLEHISNLSEVTIEQSENNEDSATSGNITLSQCRDRTVILIHRLKARLNEINNFTKAPSDINASELTDWKASKSFLLINLMNELYVQVESINNILERIQKDISAYISVEVPAFKFRAIQAALKNANLNLLPFLKQLLSKIWQIISNLMTPKEWKISGEVSGNILGLANVGLEITFGK
ncbi:MAG: hypothetical protein ABIP37_06050 [Methylotenera sp.]